jgi:hypothetical protein
MDKLAKALEKIYRNKGGVAVAGGKRKCRKGAIKKGPSAKRRCTKYDGDKHHKGSAKQRAAAKHNPWIAHVKAIYESQNQLSYKQVLSDPRTKRSYKQR